MWSQSLGFLALRARGSVLPGLCNIARTSYQSHSTVATESDTKAVEMMDSNGVMGAYAKALYLAAKNAKNVENVMRDLTSLRDAMHSCEELAIFIGNPCLRSTTKIDFLVNETKSIGMPVMQPETINCLEILFEQRRSGDFVQLAKLFETLYMATKGQIMCIAQSAAELNPKQKTALEAAIKKRLGGSLTPTMNYRINPSLLGGLVVRIGDQVIDASVSTKLDRMYQQLSTTN